MLTSLLRSLHARIWGCGAWLTFLLGGLAGAHNLDQQDTRVSFDKPTLDLMAARAAAGQSLLQAGDVIGIVLKSTPGPGTLTGAGGYLTFFIPTGTQVVGADSGAVDSTTGQFVARAMRGPSIMPLGDGLLGSASTPGLIGLNLGPNLLGVTAPAVSATGVHAGTLVG